MLDFEGMSRRRLSTRAGRPALPVKDPEPLMPPPTATLKVPATRSWNSVIRSWAIFLIPLLLVLGTSLYAEQRFPPPEFEGGHQLPVTAQPAARGVWFQYLDVIVLACS